MSAFKLFAKMSLKEGFERTAEETQAPSGEGSGSEDEDPLQQGEHPLLNDLVLQTVFGFVSPVDLKACRSVCKKWNVNAIPQMRSHFEVAIQGTQSMNRNRRIDDFVKLIQKNELGFPFGTLTLGKGTDDFNGVQIQLAVILKDSLQHLIVDPSVDNILIEYPKMPNLKSLRLRRLLKSEPKPVNLNENFPSLETLDIRLEFNFFEWNEFFSKFVSCPTLKSLSVDSGTTSISTFRDIHRVFPNLTKLDLRFTESDSEILGQIWTQMTQLESLTIWCFIKGGYRELDSHFTGIPTQTLEEIFDVVNQLGKMTAEERRNRILMLGNDHRRLPSIVNLTKLKNLNLNVTGIWTGDVNLESGEWMRRRVKHYLSNAAGYLALYTMDNLRHLVVENCNFTNRCCEILTKETGLVSWKLRN